MSLTSEQLRTLKRALALAEAARAELRNLNLPEGFGSLDLEAANSLVTAHVKLQMILRTHTEAQQKTAGRPLKAPLRAAQQGA